MLTIHLSIGFSPCVLYVLAFCRLVPHIVRLVEFRLWSWRGSRVPDTRVLWSLLFYFHLTSPIHQDRLVFFPSRTLFQGPLDLGTEADVRGL